MHKLTFTLLLGTALVASQSFTQTNEVQQDRQDVQSDVGAVQKDDAALNKDQNKLDSDRAAKAADKANGDYGSQAAHSAAIGADKTMIGEKNAEKSTDQKILKHHKKKLQKDKAKAADDANGSSSGGSSSGY